MCEWDQGNLKADPDVANERQYDSFKIDIIRRATFDPRPVEYQSGHPSQEEINHFLCELSYEDTHWALLLDLVYPDGPYSDDDLYLYFPKLRLQFWGSLIQLIEDLKPSRDHQGPFEVKDTMGQSDNVLWKRIRSIHLSASFCRKVRHYRTDASRMSHLRRYLWQLDTFQSRAMKYGIKSESIAREKYVSVERDYDPFVNVEECGLFLNTRHVGLSCSPDGIVRGTNKVPKLLEIKCPYSLRYHDPNKFETVIPQKRMSSFCLKRNQMGEIMLKTEHEYYDQVQMCMGMTETKECDFFMWSEKGYISITVPFNEERWKMIKKSLDFFQWKYQIPEYFLMRTVRNLVPIDIDEEWRKRVEELMQNFLP